MAREPFSESSAARERAKRYQVPVTYTFTHRQTLDDGRIILADPARKHWLITNDPLGDVSYTWAPSVWDETKAIAALYQYSTHYERDVS